MGRPWGPKCVRVRKKHKIGLSPPPFVTHFETFSVEHLKKQFMIYLFVGAVSRAAFYKILLDFGFVL